MIEIDDKPVSPFKLTKSRRKGRPPLSAGLCTYQQNPKLFAV